jgi:ubiquinone/menaquinone biosynthesis C-methylase UbiE
MDADSFLIPKVALEQVQLEQGMHVADFGSGAGFFTLEAAREVGAQGRVWAIDINPDLLTRVKNHAEAEGRRNVEIVRGDLEAPKGSGLPDGKTDLVLVTNVLFYIEDKLAFCREIDRVLKPGARALVIDWKDSFSGMGPHPDHVITIGAARDIFEKAGFDYEGDVPAGAYHWGFIVRKKSR